MQTERTTNDYGERLTLFGTGYTKRHVYKKTVLPHPIMNNIPHIVDTGASVRTEEPAGWMGYQDGEFICFLINRKKVKRFIEATDNKGVVVPVYKNPAELTDEEIDEIWNPNCPPYALTMTEIRDFARAILRKAQ